MSSNRLTLLFLVLALMVVAALGGWFAGTRIVSPAEAAARTAAPPPSPILIPVENRVLASNIVTRGTARFGLPQPVSIALSALKAKAGLITKLPLRNTQLVEGSVMFSASGRPVFMLQGEVPAYRDLVPGISGDDVRQLEAALERLSFDPGPVDGSYDEQTSAAVAKWYTAAGWEPMGPTPDQLANIRTLEQSLADATRSKFAASSDLAIEAARVSAELNKKTAEADIAAKISERALIALDPRSTQTQRAAADALLEVARASATAAKLKAQVEIQSAINAQKGAELDAKIAEEKVTRLTAELEQAKRKVGVQVPVDEIVFIAAPPVLVGQVTAQVGELASGPIMTVTDNKLAIDSSLTLTAAPLVTPGMEVTIDEQALGIKAKGVVERVAATPGTNGVDGYHVYFEVRVVETSKSLEGTSLRMTIPIKSTKGEVMAVPISALSLKADGTSQVRVQEAGESEPEEVIVEPGMSADGYVEVTPVKGSLSPGQFVVVGYETEVKEEQP